MSCYVPVNECKVMPPIKQAAAPVLAVATVSSGGRVLMIIRSKYDFPVPALPVINKT